MWPAPRCAASTGRPLCGFWKAWRFLFTEEGDVKLLKDLDPKEYRLRVGDYRIRFYDFGETLQILSVRHRRDAYR